MLACGSCAGPSSVPGSNSRFHRSLTGEKSQLRHRVVVQGRQATLMAGRYDDNPMRRSWLYPPVYEISYWIQGHSRARHNCPHANILGSVSYTDRIPIVMSRLWVKRSVADPNFCFGCGSGIKPKTFYLNTDPWSLNNADPEWDFQVTKRKGHKTCLWRYKSLFERQKTRFICKFWSLSNVHVPGSGSRTAI